MRDTQNGAKYRIFPTLLFLIIVFSTASTEAKNYYFSSSSGNDSRTSVQAQDPSTPWKTINQLNLFFTNLGPGDSVLFKRGEIFNGSIIIKKSGTPFLPIVIGAYGNGPKPVISGLINLSSWVNLGGGVYQAECTTCTSDNNLLLINGVQQAMGRFPNKGYLSYESHVNNTSIIDNQLPASPNWTGAEVVIRKNRWVTDKIKITSHSATRIDYAPGTNDWPIAEFGYFIQKDPKTLDQTGEWYFDPVGKKMKVFFGGSNPASFAVKTSVVNSLVSSTGYNHLVFDNISFEGANAATFEIKNSQYISIKNCNIDFSGSDAVTANWSPYLTIENSTINHSLNDGIKLDNGCTAASIRNNIIKNTGLIAGMGKSGNGTYQAIMSFGGNTIMEFNAIDSTGYSGIYFGGNSAEVRNNFISNFCLTKDDGGGIYVGDWFVSSGRKITGNIVLNGKGAGEGTNDPDYKAVEGIYIDELSFDMEISGNTVANCGNNGIYLHNSHQIDIKNNTLFNNQVQLGMYQSETSPEHVIRDNQLMNNIFFAKKESQIIANLSSISNNTNSFFNSDNNYFVRPLDDKISFVTSQKNMDKTTWNAFDVEGWQTFSGKDQHSSKSPVAIPHYTLTGLTGPDKVKGGNFTADAWNAFVWSDDNHSITSWDNTGKIDGGSLKVSYTATSQISSMATAGIIGIGALDSTKNYLLKFTSKGNLNKRTIGVYLQQASAPYHILSTVKYIVLPASRSENEILFSFPKAETNANLMFQLSDTDGPVWFDNIKLYEANVELTDPDAHIRFEYNPTNSPKTITLNENYIGVDSTKYSGSLTLQPYRSVILLKKTNNQTVPPPVVGQPSSPIYINFAREPTAPGYWNNTTFPRNGAVYPNLKNDKLETTTVGLTVTSAWESWWGAAGNGGLWNGALYPAEVTNTNWAVNNGQQSFTLTGLSTNQSYTLSFLASSKFNDVDATSTFGVNGKTGSINSYNNAVSLVTLDNLQPNAQGELVVTLGNKPNGVAYVNALVITANSAPVAPPPPPPVAPPPPVVSQPHPIYVDFARESTASGYWNKTTFPRNGTVYPNLKNEKLEATPVGLTVTSAWESWWGAAGNDGLWNGALYPAEVTNTNWSVRNGSQSFKLTGLGTQGHSLSFFASSKYNGEFTSRFTVNGKTVSVNAVNNAVNLVSLDNLQPTPQGELLVTVSSAAGGLAHINALVIRASSLGQPATLMSRGIERAGNNEVEQGLSEAGVTPYPNPFTDKVYIDLSQYAGEGTKAKLELTGLNGRILKTQDITIGAGNSRVEMNVQQLGLSPGMYLVRLTGDKIKTQTFKLVKE